MAEEWEEVAAEVQAPLEGRTSLSLHRRAWIDTFPQQTVAGDEEAGREALGAGVL